MGCSERGRGGQRGDGGGLRGGVTHTGGAQGGEQGGVGHLLLPQDAQHLPQELVWGAPGGVVVRLWGSAPPPPPVPPTYRYWSAPPWEP